MIITIDGPVASGKSTIACMLADRLKFFCLYSGMLYRAVAYILIHDFDYTVQTISNALEEYIKAAIDPTRFSYLSGGKILFDSKDITNLLKSPDIDLASSLLALSPDVRKLLTKYQRMLVEKVDAVVEGRDTGSVVFPDANIKFYLTASPEIRAKRYKEYQQAKRVSISIDEALKIIQDRDKRDKERKISPLIVPEGAIVIDNSFLTIEQTLALMLTYIKK